MTGPQPQPVPMGAKESSSLAPDQVLALQRTIGNRATRSLLADASRRPPSVVQAKLSVGAAGDRYEQEADRIAGEVVQRIDAPPGVEQAPRAPSITPLVAPAVTRSAEAAPQGPGGPAAFGADGGPVSSSTEATIAQARGGGAALPASVRAPMERAFRADFGGVRVHTDARADALNTTMGAHAFATGRDLFFKRGKYDPASWSGREMIAHELTHVLQQRAGGGNGIHRVIQRNVTAQSKKQAADDGSRGAFESKIKWKLDQKAPAKGYVIQHVTDTMKIENRTTGVAESDGDIDTHFGYSLRADWSSYYELWAVAKNSRDPSSYGGYDTFAWRGYDKGAAGKYKGTMKKAGRAWYFPSDSSMSGLGFAKDDDSPAGPLFVSDTKPAVAATNEGSAIDHHVSVKWNDGVSDDKTKIVSQSP